MNADKLSSKNTSGIKFTQKYILSTSAQVAVEASKIF